MFDIVDICCQQRLARRQFEWNESMCTRRSEAISTLYDTSPHQYPKISCSHPLQIPIDRLVLLQEQERSNGMRTQSHETGHPAPKHPPDTLVLDGPAQQPEQALRLLCAHDARLNHVDGTADRRRHKAREQRRREMRRQVVFERRVGEQGAFETVVAGELARRHKHGSHAVRPHAPP